MRSFKQKENARIALTSTALYHKQMQLPSTRLIRKKTEEIHHLNFRSFILRIERETKRNSNQIKLAIFIFYASKFVERGAN